MNRHGPTYSSWKAMKHRCCTKNPSREVYRNITYDSRWEEYTHFLADMGERPKGTTLERKDNSKGYSKNNCKWATAQEQCNNRSSNKQIKWQGKTQTISEWCRELGLNRGTVAGRVTRYGYEPELLFAPASRCRHAGNPLTQAKLAKDAKADE